MVPAYVPILLIELFVYANLGMLREIPGILKRGYWGAPLLLTLSLLGPVGLEHGPLVVGDWLSWAGGLGLCAGAVLVRFAFACPSCKKPLDAKRYTWAVWGKSVVGSDTLYFCRWCGYQVSDTALGGLSGLDRERERFAKADMWQETPFVLLAIQPMGLYGDFTQWLRETRGSADPPDDVLERNDVAGAFLESKGFPAASDVDAWQTLLSEMHGKEE